VFDGVLRPNAAGHPSVSDMGLTKADEVKVMLAFVPLLF
jgi:hypothetical protein